ncbi:DUF4129 domain-containing protein [Streptomyces sp. 150FB]|uniref:DUF4129 domain-containing protein n=1 Tax=Streptomyces sp. 150FB TaxID=1576605 RepID=UPI000A953DCE|nr:DUF4129 domain-containing protein [Streptomyces sp. 150FB]
MFITGGATMSRLMIRTSDDIPVDTSRIPAREAAERELSKPMYHEHDPNLLQRAIDAFMRWFSDLLGSVSGLTPGGVFGIVVALLIIAALVAVLWWRLGTPRRPGVAVAGSLFETGPRSAAEHRAAAETHAEAHRWNEAVQERMRAVVRSLEERALLDPRPGRTAAEAAAEAGLPLPEQAARLRAAAHEFDDVTYGGRAADQRTYLRLRELDLDLGRAKPRLSATVGGQPG